MQYLRCCRCKKVIEEGEQISKRDKKDPILGHMVCPSCECKNFYIIPETIEPFRNHEEDMAWTRKNCAKCKNKDLCLYYPQWYLTAEKAIKIGLKQNNRLFDKCKMFVK